MFLKVKELPQSLQNALQKINYGRVDVSVEVSAQVSPNESGGAGLRGFFMAVDLASGAIVKELYGSWGGANMFNPTNQVDLDTAAYPIPLGVAVIKGVTGHYISATVFVSQANVFPQLTARPAITEVEKSVLTVYLGIKGGMRKDYITGYNAVSHPGYFAKPLTDAELEQVNKDLQAKGLVKINKAGAVSVTTEGKNAV